MPNVTICRIVVASPGDVQPERDAVPAIAAEINQGVAADHGLRLEVGRWDTDAYPGFHPEGPKGLVDQVLRIEDCDIILGIFWTRFGTPVPGAQSGTEHEIQRAYEAWQQRRRPHIMVYFKQRASLSKTTAEAEQRLQVVKFQESFPKEGLWWPFKDRSHFERLVRQHLNQVIRHDLAQVSSRPRAQSQRAPRTRGVRAHLRQDGSGGSAIGHRATAAGQGGVAVGGHVFGSIYQVYQAPPGRAALTQDRFALLLREYLRWVQNAYSTTRLYGVESLHQGLGPPVRKLSEVFVPLTLRRFQVIRRAEVERLAEEIEQDTAHAYLQLAEAKRQQGKIVPLSALLTLHDRLAIVGGAGSGKSTMLAHLAASLSTAALNSGVPPLDLPAGKTTLVPVLIPLRYFREYVRLCEHAPQDRLRNPRTGTLAGFIPWHLKQRSPALETSEDFFDRLLLGSGCLLMLDGLDEVVSREDRARVRAQVESLVHDIYPRNQVIVTAREAGYREDAVFGDDFMRLDVQPLDEAQLRALVANWCTQLYPAEAEPRTAELVQAIHEINSLRAERDLLPLVSTPLMTTMVVSVKWGETELPRERAKLYEACVKVILQAQYIPDDPARKELVAWGGTWDEQRDWLAVLALAMHEGGRAGAAVPEAVVREALCHELTPENLARFIEAVRHRGGLLEEKAELFQFAHLTFQEFLASRWLAKRREAAWPQMHPHLTDPWWREVFLLTYGFAQLDYRDFAKEYLTWLSTQQSDGEGWITGLEPAGSALLELERPNPQDRRQQAERLAKVLTDRTVSASGLLRACAGATLARLGDPRFQDDAWYLPAEPLLGFVKIPAGQFLMGSEKTRDPEAFDDELPQHEVTLPTYYIGRYPVTVAQFRAFVLSSGHRLKDDHSIQGLPNHPVVNVTWYEAIKYCHWLTELLRGWKNTPEPLAAMLCTDGWQVTLPSEAEWEKAARGTDGRIYPWGNEPDPNRANYSDTDIYTSSAVGSFPGGASPYGVEDMSGNIWEWTRSVGGNYPYPMARRKRARRENLQAGRNTRRVLRGGAFLNDHWRVRCASRLRNPPYPRDWHFGFRVVVLPCR